jgi:hypothetical protein
MDAVDLTFAMSSQGSIQDINKAYSGFLRDGNLDKLTGMSDHQPILYRNASILNHDVMTIFNLKCHVHQTHADALNQIELDEEKKISLDRHSPHIRLDIPQKPLNQPSMYLREYQSPPSHAQRDLLDLVQQDIQDAQHFSDATASPPELSPAAAAILSSWQPAESPSSPPYATHSPTGSRIITPQQIARRGPALSNASEYHAFPNPPDVTTRQADPPVFSQQILPRASQPRLPTREVRVPLQTLPSEHTYKREETHTVAPPQPRSSGGSHTMSMNAISTSNNPVLSGGHSSMLSSVQHINSSSGLSSGHNLISISSHNNNNVALSPRSHNTVNNGHNTLSTVNFLPESPPTASPSVHYQIPLAIPPPHQPAHAPNTRVAPTSGNMNNAGAASYWVGTGSPQHRVSPPNSSGSSGFGSSYAGRAPNSARQALDYRQSVDAANGGNANFRQEMERYGVDRRISLDNRASGVPLQPGRQGRRRNRDIIADVVC